MIINANSQLHKNRLLSIIKIMPNKVAGIESLQVEQWLLSMLGSKAFCAFVTENNECIIAQKVDDDIAFVSFWFGEKEAKELFTSVEDWARSVGCVKLIGETIRFKNLKAFERKYGIKATKVILEKEL